MWLEYLNLKFIFKILDSVNFFLFTGMLKTCRMDDLLHELIIEPN